MRRITDEVLARLSVCIPARYEAARMRFWLLTNVKPVSPDALEGVVANAWLISIAAGVIFGAAGLRGTGTNFFSVWVEQEEQSLGAPGKALDGAFAGILSAALYPVLRWGHAHSDAINLD